MKSLKEYIIDALVEGKQKLREYEWNNDISYSFENFCKDNDVDINNEILLEDAYNFYKANHWKDYGLGQSLEYKDFQDQLYETLKDSYNGYRLIEKIKNEFSKDIINVEQCADGNISKVENRFIIDIQSLEDLTNNKTFISLLNQFNYYIIFNRKNEDGFSLRIRPSFSDEKTSEIYKDKYIYHISSIAKKNKILKYGLEPKELNGKYRIYVLRKNKNFDKHIKGLFGREKEKYLFTIDLSKTKNKLRFFLDDGATGYDAYYTLDNIPKECIIDYKIITK